MGVKACQTCCVSAIHALVWDKSRHDKRLRCQTSVGECFLCRAAGSVQAHLDYPGLYSE